MKISCETCGSSDANELYEDGHTFCFSCETYKRSEDSDMPTNVKPFVMPKMPPDIPKIGSYKSYPITSRGITQQTVDHFGVTMETNEDGSPAAHFYPYTKDNQVVAYKKRTLPKEFMMLGDIKGVQLFGQNVASGGKFLVITEGELDCMIVAQCMKEKYGQYYSVVSVPSASQTKVILENREWVRSYKEVVLMFDQDEAGQKGAEAAAKIIGADKVKISKFNVKDPCDLYKEGGTTAILNAIWNAHTYCPAGIVVGEAIWDAFMERKNTESVPYPGCLEGLNDKLGGIRQGEITLFTSGTGSGKSTVIKEIILDLLSKTDDKVGLVSLEESVGDTAEKFIAMALERPLHGHPPLTDDELKRGFTQVFGDERLVLLDHQGSAHDASLMDKIEYMALMGCKYIVLDHITIAVSEGADGLSGNEAIDKAMSDLLKIVKKHNVWLGLISHLRKAMGGKNFEEGHLASIDDIKGSGSIKQISFDIIAFSRNLVAEAEVERNTINLRVLKSRFTGRTGDAGQAIYNPESTRLQVKGGFDYN